MATSDRRREQNRINKANERARKAARAAGLPIPRNIQKYPARQDAIRAFEAKQTATQRRIEALENLPSVLSPTENIKVDRGQPHAIAGFSRKSATAQAAALRASERKQKLDVVGSARRKQLLSEMADNPDAFSNLSPEQRQRFETFSKRIARGSNQSIAILFNYQGGADTYNSLIADLKGSPDDIDIEDSLDALEALAALADKARVMYAPKKIKYLKV